MDYTFSDIDGRQWKIPAVTLHHVLGLQEQVGIQIDDLIQDGHLWNQNGAAMIPVGATLWFLCQGQHADVSEEQFFQSFDGDTFDDAQEALARRIANFTPSHRRQAILRILDEVKQKMQTENSALSESASSGEVKSELTPNSTAFGS